jgi:hypothetical protein
MSAFEPKADMRGSGLLPCKLLPETHAGDIHRNPHARHRLKLLPFQHSEQESGRSDVCDFAKLKKIRES